MHSGVHGTCDTPTCGSSPFEPIRNWVAQNVNLVSSLKMPHSDLATSPPSFYRNATTCCHRCSLTTRTTSDFDSVTFSCLRGKRGGSLHVSAQVQMLRTAASTYIFQDRWRHNSRRVQGWNYLSAYDFQIQMSVSGLIVNFFDSQPLLSHFRAEYMHPCYIARCWDL